MVDPDSGHEHESLPSYLSHVLTARVPREEWGVDPSFWCVCTVAVDGRTDGGIERVDPVENQLRRGWRSSERASEKEEEERGKQAALCELMQLLPSLPPSFL